MAPSHWRLILNGKSTDNEDLREAVGVLRKRGIQLDVRVTWEEGDAERYVAEAIADGVQTVVAAGGDGTLSEVAAALAHHQDDAATLPSLGLVPLGTANDFATAAMIPLEPLGALTAAGIWGARHAPDFLNSTVKSLMTPNDAELKQRERDCTNEVTQAALRGVVSAKDLEVDWPAAERVPPVWKMREHRRHVHRTSVRYGPRPSQLLDVWRRDDLPNQPAPVLLFVPGVSLALVAAFF